MEKMAHFLSFKTPGKIRLKPEWFPVFLIIAFGFFLRIFKVRDYILFLGDEGRDALVVYGILHGDLTLLGPTSSVGGFFLGPIYYYMMAPFMILSNFDPVGPAIMVVLFGLATIYLVYRIGYEFFGRGAGLIASFLYAISPIVIAYSRSSWNPNVFPFFTISSLYILYKAISRNKLRLFVLAGILMGINLQIHYLATFVGAIMFFYVLFSTLSFRADTIANLLKRYLSLFFGFLIGFSPFIAFELRHQFANSQNIIRFIFNSEETGAGQLFFANIQHVFARLFPGLIFSYPDFSKFSKFDPFILQLWLNLAIFIGLVSTIFFIIQFLKSVKTGNKKYEYSLIFAWMALGIGLFGLYNKSIYDYYLGFLFPVPFLLVGLLFSEITKILNKPGKVFVALALFGLFFLNLKFTPIAYLGNRQVDQVKMISHFILSKTEGKPFNFALITGGNSDHAYRYFMKLAGRDPVVIKGLDVDPQRKSATDQLFIVCETIPCYPLGYSLWEVAGFGRAEIVREWDVSVLKVYKLVHYEGE
ncbi:MAG: glycosyltransferase family 39 protein [Candidatus Levybacteria bacterium]|nr:glycosyltransferase family 39 protein [Candidatus Levybacteria bacterium]